MKIFTFIMINLSFSLLIAGCGSKTNCADSNSNPDGFEISYTKLVNYPAYSYDPPEINISDGMNLGILERYECSAWGGSTVDYKSALISENSSYTFTVSPEDCGSLAIEKNNMKFTALKAGKCKVIAKDSKTNETRSLEIEIK